MLIVSPSLCRAAGAEPEEGGSGRRGVGGESAARPETVEDAGGGGEDIMAGAAAAAAAATAKGSRCISNSNDQAEKLGARGWSHAGALPNSPNFRWACNNDIQAAAATDVHYRPISITTSYDQLCSSGPELHRGRQSGNQPEKNAAGHNMIR
uniref:Uncharacterized protein n=1 Tax=Oryza punctata TaxID=4537 RepID=A0A0E0M7S9_ORYPU